ncbi:MAG: amino acid adenylation domain-containing protein, partial [Colwellia sp.]|nr:amino acid adenylation domain-containing protein [Colwellia sp.]
LEMVIGLLAILKAGGAYVPLDPANPAERLNCMIEDSGLQLLLTQSSVVNSLSIAAEINVLLLDENTLESYSEKNLLNVTHPKNLAYVIFTSGSTGRPKGVCIDHVSLASHTQVSIDMLSLTGKDTVLQFAVFSFDTFAEQLYPALCCGAAVVLRGKDIWDSEKFYQQLIKHNISVADLSSAYWYQLVREYAQQGERDYGALRLITVGGETMPVKGLHEWNEAGLSHVGLFNAYGPTEATVTSTLFDCNGYVTGELDIPSAIPIGHPLGGRATYVLDTSLHPAPVGVVGELCIGGELLARGYRGQASLTAERFIADPFSEEGGRLYRTGDLARYQVDGTIEYVGRIDHQVKIRGFRIELGEIESQLQSHDAIRDAVVLAQEGVSGQQLVAYVIANDSQIIEADDDAPHNFRAEIKAHLQQALPEYMVPAHILLLEELPLTPNGKLDRKALPKADVSQLQQRYEAPRTILEKQLAEIWQEVLGIEQVGLHDNFFELGGHSLLVVQMSSQIKNKTQHVISLSELMFKPTIMQLADFLCNRNEGAGVPMVRLNSYQGNASPLFCIHPAGGNVYPYYSLALKLNDQRPVFGIINRSYVESDWLDNSWHDMVHNYVAYIRNQQAQGPYLLLGWSSGGLLAIEIAHVLEQQGEKISFLGVLDSSVNGDIDRGVSDNEPHTSLNIEEVVEADGTHHNGITVDIATQEYLRFVANVFICVDFEMLLTQYITFRKKELSPEAIRKAMAVWLAQKENILPKNVTTILDNYRYEQEMGIMDKVQNNLAELENAFVFNQLSTAPDFWWANLSWQESEIKNIEYFINSKTQGGKFRRIAAKHEDFVYSAELLESIKVVISQK